MNGRKYQIHGNIIRSEDGDDSAFMGITYWVDMTEYDDIRMEYENSRPVACVLVIDNMDELVKNQPDRIKNDIRDAIEDKLNKWCDDNKAIIRRYERDRYLILFESRCLEQLKAEKFSIIQEVHQVESPTGIDASISLGLGVDASSLAEALQYATVAIELALSRGGDQAVIKNRLSFEFFGGRGSEVEKRTKVKSRVMANTLAELVRDSSKVLVMGHKFADLDSVGGAVGVCALARLLGVKANIVIDLNKNYSGALIEMVRRQPEYHDTFISPQEAMLRADGRTLLVVVDTNRPEQVEDESLLTACSNRLAVIDHHRRAATYIKNATLTLYEPNASSTCELVTELIQELCEPTDILPFEADAVLSGIVLDTKNFTIRTGDRTFDAAAFLRRSGADTTRVKKLFQNGMEETMERYDIMKQARIYKGIAVVAAQETQNRIVAAQAADELLNISGVNASAVLYPTGDGGVAVSARSIGNVNVQVLLETLGGGGNRSAAGAQIPNCSLRDAVNRLFAAIDEYCATD